MNKYVSTPILALLAGLGLPALTGCSTVVTSKPQNPNDAPKGVRVYPPKIYFLVDTKATRTEVVVLPDYARAYDVKPRTVFAKQDFKVEMDEGQLKSLVANQDTTSFLTFFKEAATLAAKTTGAAVSLKTFEATFGLETGIYVLQDDGKLKRQ